MHVQGHIYVCVWVCCDYVEIQPIKQNRAPNGPRDTSAVDGGGIQTSGGAEAPGGRARRPSNPSLRQDAGWP